MNKTIPIRLTQTAIGFSLLAVGNVSLKIYDVLGREVTTLINNETMEEGMHEIQFDASRLSSGVYYYRLQAGTLLKRKDGVDEVEEISMVMRNH